MTLNPICSKYSYFPYLFFLSFWKTETSYKMYRFLNYRNTVEDLAGEELFAKVCIILSKLMRFLVK